MFIYLLVIYEILLQQKMSYLKQLEHVRLTNKNCTVPLRDHDDVSPIWTSLINKIFCVFIFKKIDKCSFRLKIVARNARVSFVYPYR